MFLAMTKFSSNVVSTVGRFNLDSTIPFSWIDDSTIIFCRSLLFSSLWFVCFYSTIVVVINIDSVAFWNLISFFIEVVVASFVSLSTWACSLLCFVTRLLLPCLHVGCFVDLKITPFEGLFWCSTLLLMVIVVQFLAIREMSLFFELLWCSRWGIILGPPSPPSLVLLIPFNKYCFVELYVSNLRRVIVWGLFLSHVLYHQLKQLVHLAWVQPCTLKVHCHFV